jgi:hypothetical protein
MLRAADELKASSARLETASLTTSLGPAMARWWRATHRPFLCFVAALFVLAFVADWHFRPVVPICFVALVAATSWLGRAVRSERIRAHDYPVARARRAVSALQASVGIAGMLAAGKTIPVVGVEIPDAIGFAGVGLMIVALGALMSEARLSTAGAHVRGPVLLGVGFAVLAGALIVLPAGRLFTMSLLLGAVLAEIGTELHSADALPFPPRSSPWASVALGVALVFVCGGLLVASGASVGAAIIVLCVVVAITWMAASDSDSLLLVLLAAGALMWALAPREAELNPAHQAVAGQEYFLVLGDSYMSGEGARSFFSGTNTTQALPDHTNECRRAPSAWANLLANSPPAGIPSRMLFLACSGALTEHIRTDAALDEKTGKQRGPAELVAFRDARLPPPKFVLIGVGGNDAGFGTLGPACAGPGDCTELGDVFLDHLRTVEPKLMQTFHDVRDAVDRDVPIIVVGYPKLITDTGSCSSVLLTTNERKLVVRFVDQLNAIVRSAATRSGFIYLEDVETALIEGQNRLCEGVGPSGLNFIGWNPKGGSVWDSLNPQNWVHNSLHPNAIGHEAIYTTVKSWFEAHRFPLLSPSPSKDPPHQVPTMAGLFKFGDTTLCDPATAVSCDVDNNGWTHDQTQRLIRAGFLPILIGIAGAWLIAMTAIRWASFHNLDTAWLFLAWLRQPRPRP